MKFLVVVLSLFIGASSWANTITKDPKEFSEAETGDSCEVSNEWPAPYLGVVCTSEEYLDDTIECRRYDDGVCRPNYNVPYVQVCELTFKKLNNDEYQLVKKTCEAERSDY